MDLSLGGCVPTDETSDLHSGTACNDSEYGCTHCYNASSVVDTCEWCKQKETCRLIVDEHQLIPMCTGCKRKLNKELDRMYQEDRAAGCYDEW